MAFFVSAVVAAVAAPAVATIATAVAEVGTALSVVGAVTKNPTLTKVGGIMGLAGGAGALASGLTDGAVNAATDTVAGGAAGAEAANTAGDAAAAGGASAADQGIDAAVSQAANSTGDLAAGTGGVQTAAVPTPTTTILSPAGAGAQDPGIAAPTTSPSFDSSPDGAPGADSSVAPAPAAGANPANPQASAPSAPTTQTADSLSPPQAPSDLGGSAAYQANNITDGQMAGSSANLPSGSVVAGASPIPPVQPAGGANLDSLNNTGWMDNIKQGPPPDSMLTGITKWVEAHPNSALALGQIGGHVISGIGGAYAANRNFELGQGQLALAQQKQANANSIPKSAGIINTARKNAAGTGGT